MASDKTLTPLVPTHEIRKRTFNLYQVPFGIFGLGKFSLLHTPEDGRFLLPRKGVTERPPPNKPTHLADSLFTNLMMKRKYVVWRAEDLVTYFDQSKY